MNIRKTLALLKNAGLIETKAGVGGTVLRKPLVEVSLGMVFRAVEPPEEELFRQHEHPNVNCPVGRSIQDVFDKRASEVQAVMMRTMDGMCLADFYTDMKEKIRAQDPH